jgi:hypothetical protein
MDREFVFIRKKIPLTRTSIYLSLLCCLLIPLLFMASYGASMGVHGMFFIALPSLLFGGGGGWLLLKMWEKKMQHSVTHLVNSKMGKPQDNSPLYQEIQLLTTELDKVKIGYEHQINLMQSSVAKSKEEVHQLHLEMDKKLEEMRLAYLEFEDLRKEYHRLEEEGSRFQEEAQKNLKHKDSLIAEYQKTISEQRMIIEKKQRYIAKLEGKVRDLMYEIRSLLQLETAPSGAAGGGLDLSEQAIIDSFLPSSQAVQTRYDFSVQLQKYVEKAESLTGIDHLGYVGGKSPRFLDPSVECYAIDRRRLFDSFQDETAGIVFIYSHVERKFLFVNHLVKSLAGWSPEKFMKEFPRLVVQGYLDWEEALSKVKTLKGSSARLAILDKGGHPKLFECYMGTISKGPFAHNALGIFVSQ